MRTQKKPDISVIISTYNSVNWLRKVLISYEFQSFKNFELIIADDGSTDETRNLIHGFNDKFVFEIKHVWHSDKGFRKCEILNKAITVSDSEYIIMTDGDCLARNDFVQVHMKKRERGYFLSGGYFKLPLGLSLTISEDHIMEQNCFDARWLLENGLKKTFKLNKLTAKGVKAFLLNNFTTSKATWNGHNSSGWKKDMLNINGFDERMKYGGEDREFGERLINLGVKSKQIRYSAICVHLEHDRHYVNKKDAQNNKLIRKQTKRDRVTWTNHGILK